MNNLRFTGKVAIITGASAGIGLAVADILLREGAQVVLNARGHDRLQQCVARMNQNGYAPLMTVGDASSPQVIEQIVQTAIGSLGRIDILINNAGGGTHSSPVSEINRPQFRQTMSANLEGAFFLSQAVLPQMKLQRYGRIVNVSSFAGRSRSRLAGLDYSTAKAGMLGFTRHLAWDVGQDGITVNAITPGVTKTDRVISMWNARSEDLQSQILNEIPLRRLAEPQEVAEAIAFLASDQASYVTGVSLDVNGGAYMA